MKKSSEIVARENEFKGKCNIERFELSQYISVLKDICGFELPNIVTIYRNKIWEFEMFFEDKGMFFFDDNCYLRVIIKNYLDEVVARCYSDYLVFANVLAKSPHILTLKKPLIKAVADNLNVKIDIIRSIEVTDLPVLFEIGINNKLLYSNLLPDTCIDFTRKCLSKLLQLGFDLKKDIDVISAFKACNDLEQISNNLIKLRGKEERIEAFKNFIDSMNINLESDLLKEAKEKKDQYHL